MMLCTAYNVSAQDFVYKAKNPAFGGDTFNYNWLLSSATAQNSTQAEETDEIGSNQNSTLDDFQNSLNRQILSQLSRQLVSDNLGNQGLQPGTFTAGNFTIDVVETLNGVVITIIDLTTGGQSVIEVPNF